MKKDIEFLKRYDYDQAKLDLLFVQKFRKLCFLLHSREKRVWHMARYNLCWLRYHRWIKSSNSFLYLFSAMNQVEYTYRLFEYLNTKVKND